MTKKVVQPDKEQDYFVVKGELNQIIKKMVEEAFPGLFGNQYRCINKLSI